MPYFATAIRTSPTGFAVCSFGGNKRTYCLRFVNGGAVKPRHPVCYLPGYADAGVNDTNDNGSSVDCIENVGL